MTTCIAPGCTAEAATNFTAGQDGRLGGHDWRVGDLIEVCMPHANDMSNTRGAAHPEQVAEWLRPDAADPPNTWHPARRLFVGPLTVGEQP